MKRRNGNCECLLEPLEPRCLLSGYSATQITWVPDGSSGLEPLHVTNTGLILVSGKTTQYVCTVARHRAYPVQANLNAVTILEDGELIGAAQTDFNGVVTQIPQATGLNAQGGQLQGFIPTSASNQGDIVGVVTDYFAEPFPAPADYQYVLTEYHATTQQTTALDGGILVSGYAYINDAGLAVFYDDASEGPTIYNTADGQSTNIDAGPAGTASPTGINQNGDVIGTAFSGVRLTGFLYDPSNHSVTIFPTTANCQQFNPIAINDDGTVVGDAEFEVKVRHHHAWQKRAAIYSGGVITDLNTLAPLDGVVLTEATSINDAGQILADDAINPVASANHLYVLAPR